ncbi:PEP-CTERM sorting domain-containing protein [Undibacterium sp. SXout20W]|uniref:PEP-CTERM sorting domain-containing protein n=1 Tax=Undibacterium sp. SXout20W TaxID=3413051 RepID=UPI003BF30B7F
MKSLIFLCASVFFQAANADQIFSYTEGFTNPNDSQSTFVLSGTFSESSAGVLTNLSSSILANGNFSANLTVDSISASKFVSLPNATQHGLPLQINGFFIGPAGNRNSITSCGQVFLNGSGCADWQTWDSTVRSQGLTDIRTLGAGIGGAQLSNDSFSQTSALQLSEVPEPNIMLLFFAGLALLSFRRQNKQQ